MTVKYFILKFQGSLNHENTLARVFRPSPQIAILSHNPELNK